MCDIEFYSESNFRKINKKYKRLNKKFSEIFKLMIIAVAKFQRLLKQKKFFILQKTEMVRRDLKNVNKLEKLKIQKKTTRVIINDIDFFSILSSFFFEFLICLTELLKEFLAVRKICF